MATMIVSGAERDIQTGRALPQTIPPFESLALDQTLSALERNGVVIRPGVSAAIEQQDGKKLAIAMRYQHRFPADRKGRHVHLSTETRRLIRQTIRLYEG